MKKLLTVFLCSFFLFGTVAVCSAVGFTLQSYKVTALSEDPGLVMQTKDILAKPTSFDLNLGDSKTFDLFKIWTNEEAVNWDDKKAKQIKVEMGFTAPYDFGGVVYGYTYGFIEKFWIFDIPKAKVVWKDPVVFSFGPNLDGELKVYLTNEEFNLIGCFDTCDTVGAKFKYIAEASAAPVPEPSTILLMGAGLLGLVTVGRRKFNRKE
jgi:hypothetical protein